MIINGKSSNVETLGSSNIRQATIAQHKLSKLQYILTKGLYSDAIGSTIVELTNNAIDSVIESGKNPKDYPVVVKIGTSNYSHYISIQDKGKGIDDWDFENILMCYLESTKENSNELIGSFGLIASPIKK